MCNKTLSFWDGWRLVWVGGGGRHLNVAIELTTPHLELLSQEAAGCASGGREATVRHTQDRFTAQGYGRSSCPGPGAGPPRDPCITGQVWPEDMVLQKLPGLKDREVGVRRPALGSQNPAGGTEQGRAPTSHPLRVSLHSLP